MPANSAPIGDAIVADLQNPSIPANPLPWPTGFTISRAYLTTQLLENTTAFTCYVTPENRDSEPEARGIERDIITFLLCFVVKLPATAIDVNGQILNGAIDPYVNTVETIQDMYATKRKLTVPGNAAIYVMSAGTNPLYTMRALDEQLLFVAYMEVTVKVWN